MPTPIYHITPIKNLPSILNSGGLIANSRLKQQRINYLDIAHTHIQERRARKQVTCSAGGFLPDYVPFYFAPRSPMLYAIHKGGVKSYCEGQELVIYLVSEVEAIAANNLTFAFTDGHAVIALSEFYDSLEDLESVIDWKIMEETYWADTQEDGDRSRRRQAEFLVHEFLPWTLITKIAVKNSIIAEQVREILQKFNCQTPVRVYSSWYY
ncbi:DUF4433 domain-containing protein [Tolypothrix campylonemoides VB511288]|nr:DUF4433 domain-containing protein [Tolypothrix campylonemoides VB511288]